MNIVIARIAFVAASMGLFTALSGCDQHRMTRMNKVEVGALSERPGELDRLEVFIGRWQGTAEHRMGETDETLRYEGSSEITWEAGRRVLLERSTLTRNGVPESHIAVTAWDPQSRVYRVWKFDSSGAVVAAESWNNEIDPNTWRITRRTRDMLVEGTLTVSPDGSRMDSTYEMKARDGTRIAFGNAAATRIP